MKLYDSLYGLSKKKLRFWPLATNNEFIKTSTRSPKYAKTRLWTSLPPAANPVIVASQSIDFRLRLLKKYVINFNKLYLKKSARHFCVYIISVFYGAALMSSIIIKRKKTSNSLALSLQRSPFSNVQGGTNFSETFTSNYFTYNETL